MGRILRKILLYLTATVLTLILISAGLLWWGATHPEQVWGLAKRFLPADLQVTWSEIQFKPEKITWTHWNIDWEIKGLRITKTDPELVIPIDDAAVVFSFSVISPATRADFERIRVQASQPVIYLPGPPGPQKVVERSLFEQLRSYMHYLELGGRYFSMRSLDVNVQEFRTKVGDDQIAGSVQMMKPASEGAGDTLRLRVDLKGKAIQNLNFDGWLSPARAGGADAFSSAHLEFSGYGLRGMSDFSAFFNSETFRFSLKGPWSYAKDKTTASFAPEVTLIVDAEQADLRLITAIGDLPKPMVAIDKLEGRLTLPLKSGSAWSDEPGKFSLGAPIGLFFIDKDMRPPLEKSCACRIPETLLVNYSGSVWMRPLTQDMAGRPRVLDSRLRVEGVHNKLFDADLAAGMEIYKESGRYLFLPKLDSEIHLHSFLGLRRYLDARGVLIPAPFNVLDGTVDVTAHDDVKFADGRSRTPVNVNVKLGSENQRVDLSSTVIFDLDSALKDLAVYVSVVFEDFQVQLPPLDPIGGTPKVVKDSRLQLVPPTPPDMIHKAKFRVRVFYEARTAKPGAIRLLSKYALPNVPISLDLKRAGDGVMTGSVQLEPFRIQYLRRTVHVEQMRMLMDEKDTGDFPVDGRFRIDQTQYRITIEVSGTLRQPLVRFSSDPYLPKNEIISVLLYDRTSDQLVAADAETVGSFESAVADRAIGLFGLWAFASTPIRSFSYNPVTKVYAATVQLADGLTAGIGTNWEEAAHLEVRKRVSRRWVLTASWAPSSTDRSQVGKLELQWEKRF